MCSLQVTVGEQATSIDELKKKLHKAEVSICMLSCGAQSLQFISVHTCAM